MDDLTQQNGYHIDNSFFLWFLKAFGKIHSQVIKYPSRINKYNTLSKKSYPS